MRRAVALLAVLGVVVLAYGAGARRGDSLPVIGWVALTSLLIGSGMGAAYARARRGYSDWRDSRRRTRVLRGAAIDLFGVALRWGVGIAFLAVGATWLASRGHQ